MKIHFMQEKTVITLPVTPESYSVSTSQNNQTVNIVSLGDLNLMGNKGLRELSFSSFFPASKLHGGYQTQAAFKEPFRLMFNCAIFVNFLLEPNFAFLINEFSYEQKDGSGDVYYSISLSEYVRPKVTLKVGNVVTLANNRGKKSNEQQFYVVKRGDTLKTIAKAKLGSSRKFTKIAQLNMINAPYEITAGQVLKIK